VTLDMDTQAQRERHLNDKLRWKMPHGSVRIRGGAKQLSNDQLVGIMQLIRAFNDFGPDSIMGERHNNGAVEFEGIKIVWKIEADQKRVDHQPNRIGDSAFTPRFLIIMLLEEA
jgi:Protein of unknown function (DUF3768)